MKQIGINHCQNQSILGLEQPLSFLAQILLVFRSYKKKIMHSYSNQAKNKLSDCVTIDTFCKTMPSRNDLNMKKQTNKPPLLFIPNRKTYQQTPQMIMTPKTARTSYQCFTQMTTSNSRSINVTPQKKWEKKESYFTTPRKEAQLEHTENKIITESHTFKHDFSIKNGSQFPENNKKTFRDVTNKDPKQTMSLRQTLSNTTAAKFPKFATHSKKNSEVIFTKEDDVFKKKLNSQYTFTPRQKFQKQQGTYLYNTINKTKLETNAQTQQNNYRQGLNFKSKYLKSFNTTPRNSREKLNSTNQNKNKQMAQTDPNGAHFQKFDKSLSFSVKREQNSLKLQDFQIGPCKGQGRFGKVYPARHKKSGFLVGIKQIKKESVKILLDQFIREIKISLFLNHANVVKMYGFFHDKTNFYILMQYMEEGSLYKVIKANKKLSQDQTKMKLYQICEAVNYLHSHDILHRDIKPENIVLSNGVSKLCDFGWAIYSKERRTTYCGTLDYVCPQILEGESYDNFVDIWAVGVLAYEMLTGKAPFYHISRQETMNNIMKCQLSYPEEMSVESTNFIKKALQKRPNNRYAIEQLLKDVFLLSVNHKN